ncbi:YhgE/Pip family protein [Leucobacter luti]|nr:YhgE/Pip family protein [Leucobacter luti]
MSAALSRLSGRKPVRWTTIVGLMLVPLTVAGVLLWGLWNPTERLDTVTAAIVNNDEAVEVDGQLVPLGRVLAGELIGDAKKKAADDQTNFTWVLTDEEDATAGLDDGRYATVITIPESFSAAATSLSGDPDDAEQATIDIAESDRGRLIDTALSGIVTQTATTVLNQQLGEQFVGSVFVGMTELHKGIGEAADGATQLADGGEQLTDGANQLADGTQQLADGTQQLSSGAGELASGAGSLASGAGELAGGAGSLSSGANDLAGGAGTLAGGLRLFASGDGTAANPGMSGFANGLTQYSAGARVLATGDGTETNPGLAGLASGVEAYTSGVNEALTGLQAGAGAAIEPLTQLKTAIEAGAIPVENPGAVAAQLGQLITELQGASSSAPESPVEQLKAQGVPLPAACGRRQLERIPQPVPLSSSQALGCSSPRVLSSSLSEPRGWLVVRRSLPAVRRSWPVAPRSSRAAPPGWPRVRPALRQGRQSSPRRRLNSPRVRLSSPMVLENLQKALLSSQRASVRP